jgi:hypothetical protein
MPTPSNEWRSVVATLALLIGAGSCDRCKKKETQPEKVVPTQGGATQDVVSTGIGVGLGIPAKLAPTSTKWTRVVVVDDRNAFLLGETLEQAIALRTRDRGRTWTALKAAKGAWTAWGVADDASIALTTGKRKKMNVLPGRLPTIQEGQAHFGPETDDLLSSPAPLFPNDDKLAGVAIDAGWAEPAVLGGELISLVVDQRRRPLLMYGVPGAQQTPDPVKLPPGRFVRAPYGRPAQLLSLKGAALQIRPWPSPGSELDPASPIPGIAVTRPMADQLDRGAGCDAGPMSFVRLPVNKQKAFIVGVSNARAFAFPVPGGEDPTFGCNREAIVVTVNDPKKNEPKLIRCTLDGKCADPQSNPFAPWQEKHERVIQIAATPQGAVATMTAKTGTRHGAYVSVSTDKGESFALARTINEGETERGFIEVAALVPFPDRVVMLISADVTGTRRRGWYVLATDDGGEHWGPP